MKAGLYLVATPIGNMEDITLRALSALREADRLYAEDTRHTRGLLGHYGIKREVISCHEHNEAQRADEIADAVLSGLSVAFVSDAGLPGISDPGERLASRMILSGLPVSVLPGASASLTALILSGLPSSDACFVGFLPRSGSERRARLTSLARHHGTLIIYESPLRVADTARELSDLFGDRPAALVRELTKLYEETVRGTLASLADRFRDAPPKGECVLLVGGCTQSAATGEDLEILIKKLLRDGLSAKDAAKQASALLDVPRNDAYRLALALKDGEGRDG